MAHSHNRTLIASLGFADPDKSSGDHDDACMYLASDEGARKLLKCLLKPEYYADIKEIKTTMERPLTKGNGPYKTIVGFLDVFIDVSFAKEAPPTQYLIEVKIAKPRIGDLIRQIKLYREFMPVSQSPWVVVVTPFAWAPQEKEALRREHIGTRTLDTVRDTQLIETTGTIDLMDV